MQTAYQYENTAEYLATQNEIYPIRFYLREIDTGYVKKSDGVTKYNDLPYVNSNSEFIAVYGEDFGMPILTNCCTGIIDTIIDDNECVIRDRIVIGNSGIIKDKINVQRI